MADIGFIVHQVRLWQHCAHKMCFFNYFGRMQPGCNPFGCAPVSRVVPCNSMSTCLQTEPTRCYYSHPIVIKKQTRNTTNYPCLHFLWFKAARISQYRPPPHVFANFVLSNSPIRSKIVLFSVIWCNSSPVDQNLLIHDVSSFVTIYSVREGLS